MTRRIRQQSRGKPGEVRPTTSRVLSALFSMFGPEGVEGLSVLDLYAGSGSFGLEALRRGAARVVMVEKHHRRCEELKMAVAKLSAEARGRVVRGDALRSISLLEGPFDVVFADPPYADDPFEVLLEKLVENSLIAADGTVFLEHFHKTEMPEAMSGLRLVTRRQYGDSAISVYRPEQGRRHESEAETGEGA